MDVDPDADANDYDFTEPTSTNFNTIKAHEVIFEHFDQHTSINIVNS